MRAWLLPCVLLAVACRTVPPPREDVDAVIERYVVRTAVEAEPIDSEMLAVAERYAAESSLDGPHSVAIVNVGSDALAARIHAIRAARERIDFQVFAFDPDDSGNFVFVELVRAAERGVQVRLLLDQLGTPGGIPLHRIPFVHENLELRLFNPVAKKYKSDHREFANSILTDFGKTNHRMHNKVLVVDDLLGITGGRNVADRYFDMSPHFNYLDRDVVVLGPAAKKMRYSVDQYWNHGLTVPVQYLADVGWDVLGVAEAGGLQPYVWPSFERLAWVDEQADHSEAADVMPFSPLIEAERIDFRADPPTKMNADGEHVDLFEELDQVMEEYTLLQSNYLVFSDTTFDTLERTMAEDPDRRIHYSTNSLAATQNLMTYGLGRKQRMAMVMKGLRVHELRPVPTDIRHFCPRYDALVAESLGLEPELPDIYEPRMFFDETEGPQFAIHSKTAIIDGEIAIIGSHNFDPRSEFWNTEAAVVLWGAEIVSAAEAEVWRYMDNRNSWTVAPRKRIPVWREFTGIVGSISRTLPFFDLWPFHYSSAFELKEGMEPVPIEDPRFYDHYEDVGELPETTWGWKRIKTSLIQGFGGIATPLM